MTIIEQAVKRLEALRQAGVECPSVPAIEPADGTAPRRASAPFNGTDPAAVPAGASGPLASNSATMLGVAGAAQPSSSARLVAIDLQGLAKLGYVTPDFSDASSTLAAEYRIVKRPLMKATNAAAIDPTNRRANLIMVTSALSGEGKTFTALNLAMSMAMEVDRTVLLVDADVVRPAILDRCGLQPSPGLLDILSEQKPLGDVLLRTNVPKLALLPAGTPRANATELLASAAMDHLLEELATRYRDRIVVFDAPPLLPSPESRVLAAHVGQVVVVVEQGRSNKESVRQAFAMLQGCPNVSSILNKCQRTQRNSLYDQYLYDAAAR